MAVGNLFLNYSSLYTISDQAIIHVQKIKVKIKELITASQPVILIALIENHFPLSQTKWRMPVQR